MSFSAAIKKQLMIDSARKCCVCNRYKGVGVEIHHIIPKASGGEDTYDNGIVLCFDCHCAAGHYNLEHPRGTKFSPEELRGHKERWFESVSKNSDKVDEQSEDHKIICRYYVTSDIEAASKFINSNENSLIQTDYFFRAPQLFEQFQKMKSAYDGILASYEVDDSEDDFYQNREELIKDYPEFEGRQSSPLNSRVVDKGKLKDPFALMLLDAGTAPENVASMNYFNDACGGSGWGVDFQTRKPYFVFAQIMNLDTETIRITSLNNQPFELNPLTNSDVFEMTNIKDLYKLNNIELLEKQSISLFLGVIAGPIDYNPGSYQFECGLQVDENNQGEFVERVSYNTEGVDSDFSTCGKLYIPKTLSFFKRNQELEVSFENLSPETLFIISKEWLCGSCPHLFGICKSTDDIKFIKTLFDNSDGGKVLEVIQCKQFSKLIIAEFDNEISEITSIMSTEDHVILEKELRYGDSIELDVNNKEEIIIEGFYKAKIQSPKNASQRRQKHSKFLAYEKELRAGLLSVQRISI